METATISEFRGKISKFLDGVEQQGEHILVFRGGKPIAEVVPVQGRIKGARDIPRPIKLGFSLTKELLRDRKVARF